MKKYFTATAVAIAVILWGYSDRYEGFSFMINRGISVVIFLFIVTDWIHSFLATEEKGGDL